MIRLMVIDDHEIVRSGMVKMIRGTEIQLIAESNSGENILEGIAQYQPDVILLDVRMESGDGLTVLGRAKAEYPQIPVLMFSAFDDPIYVARSVTLGASGYLSKTLDREQIIEAITGAYHGGNSWTRGSEIRKDAEERNLFSRFTSEMIEATKTMVAECEAINLTEYGGTSGFAELNYFQFEHSFDFDKLVHRVGIDGDSSYEIVGDVMTLLERCNCDADRIWFCECSLGDVDYKYTPTYGELWFVTGTEEEALEKIRATAEVVRQMENT